MKKTKIKVDAGVLSFRPAIKYIIRLYVIILIAELTAGSMYVFNSVKKEADFVVSSTKSQIDYRVSNTLALLTSLAQDQSITAPEISYEEKAAKLTQYSNTFGYMMIRIVDKDLNVWNENGLSANLSKRDYMQRLFATGEPQVTDSFAAGADGVTLNYTVVVPIFRNGVFDGGIFGAIYFGEIVERLHTNLHADYQQLQLFGSNTQLMSASSNSLYGENFTDLTKNSKLFGVTAKQVEADMYNQKAGNYWRLGEMDLHYTAYRPIGGTPWTLVCELSFMGALGQYLPQFLGVLLISTIACIVLVYLANRSIDAQMGTVNMMIASIQDLEKRLYQNEKPGNMDFKEIINLTSKGLTDSLTGVITRTVFLNQIPVKIKQLKETELAALCFVDVDNLKTINDTFGHDVGDIALKDIGYVLREYEKKYEGLVGRHGGDEFILLLTGFESQEALERTVAELTDRLHQELIIGETVLSTQCSIGVAVCDSGDKDVDALIKQADEMLYTVKAGVKGSYKIFFK